MIDTLYYVMAKFEVYLDDNCQHLLEKVYKTQIKRIQNISASIFFLSVQVPLSYLSAGFAFLTAFVSWLIDSKTKAEIY